MEMEFRIKIGNEVPKYLHIYNIQVESTINGTQYNVKENIRDDADPVFFDYIWEKIGEKIKEAYMKSLKLPFE